MSVRERLAAAGLELPAVPAPAAAYVPGIRFGTMVQTSGQLPVHDGGMAATGLVGADVTLEQAQDLARQCALNVLAVGAAHTGGDLEQLRLVKLTVFVASADGFTSQHLVANGASLLLGELLGDRGIHARSAVGVAMLPLDAAVEVEGLFEIVAP